ncbi:hypothetical protein T492DRAFT_843626 [Pavlovales sp. CCMP2436]|nr:hypothetical protein T492DRAFT_843626 [Pavlovales sp. CCMP2436]
MDDQEEHPAEWIIKCTHKRGSLSRRKQSPLRKRMGLQLGAGQRTPRPTISPKNPDSRNPPSPPTIAASACARSHTAHLRNAHMDKHYKSLGTALPGGSTVTDVAVDGSHKEMTEKIAGGVAYLINYPDGRREIHMTNAFRPGDKDALDSELTAATLSLRLKSLQTQTTLATSWDCLSPLRNMWRLNPNCNTATNTNSQRQHQCTDETATPSRQLQLRRLSELLTRNTHAGKTYTIKHQKAYKADSFLRPLIQYPRIDTASQVYIIDNAGTDAHRQGEREG